MVEMEYVLKLRESVDELREEVQVLRNVVDELRGLIEWATRNPEPTVDQWRQAHRIFSIPLDPAAPDFHERLNEVEPSEVTTPTAVSSDLPKDQRKLF